MTAHNHGFAVRAPLDAATQTPYGEATVSHVCLNDDVVEGLELRRDGRLVAFSVQYHPEAAAGPHDAAYLFDRFCDLMAGASMNSRVDRGLTLEPSGSVEEVANCDRPGEPTQRVGPPGASAEGGRLMPQRDDIHSVLVIGSGPIVIGQACEFDYSGTQACRVLRQEGIRVVLVNSNPATIMTDPEFADATYVEPITPGVRRAGDRQGAPRRPAGHPRRPDRPQLRDEPGRGRRPRALRRRADRREHRGHREGREPRVVQADRRGACPRSGVPRSRRRGSATPWTTAWRAAGELGYPVVVRPSFTMGGAGSGLAYDEDDLHRIAGAGLAASPTTEVLLEESILGWKEYELEVMRDRADNVVIVCSIENVDPMGVHTGDSITVAPALTLTDREYQRLRDISIGVIREVGVDTGGCNIQFAVNPVDGRIVVIEMNPRVSRSSALACKATGFPIAKIAAKVAIGYTLDEIPNDITTRPDGQSTPASFEPTLDYVVVKVPRFAFEKFPGADPTLTTHMKSVGEAMAIGRNFTEALQKALRSLESPSAVFDWHQEWVELDKDTLLEQIRVPHDGRLKLVMDAIRAGATPEEIFEATAIDPWFLDQLALINEVAAAGDRRARADARPAAPGQAPRLLRRPDRQDPRDVRRRRPRRPPRARDPAGLQDRRHLRRRVRRRHALPLLDVRRGDRGRAARPSRP